MRIRAGAKAENFVKCRAIVHAPAIRSEKRLNIALIEDDAVQAELLSHWLVQAGYTCEHFATGQAFLDDLDKADRDLLVVDWELPDMTGIEVLSAVRSRLDWRVPVLFVTQRDEEDDIVLAFNTGADDYMVKQISEREFLARVSALIRRFGQHAEHIVAGPFKLDRLEGSAQRCGEPVSLTRKDFELAWFLFNNVGRLLSRDVLLKEVWGVSSDVNTRTVDVHISRIRKRLGITPESGFRIRTIYQHGYRLESVASRGTA